MEGWTDDGKVEIWQLCQQHPLNVSGDISRSIRDLEIRTEKVSQLVNWTC